MMDFHSAWQTASIGAVIAASNNDLEPPKEEDIRKWARWRQCNFMGTVIEKEEGRLVVKMPPDDNGEAVFVVTAERDCVFSFPTPNLDTADKVARTQIEDDAEKSSTSKLRLARQIMAMQLWSEAQMFKLITDWAVLTNEERTRRVPFLAAIAQRKSIPVAQVVGAIETRLWDRIWGVATDNAKLLDGHDAVKAATTPEAKLAVVDSIIWSEE